jgi:hypothetical protein
MGHDAPFCSPAISAEEPAVGHIVADGADGVTAKNGFAGFRHVGVTCARDGIGFKTFVDGEPEDERITRGEAALHLREGLNQALITHRGMLSRLGITGSRGFGVKPINKIRPHRLGTGPLFSHSLNPVAEHGAGIGIHRAFDDALVVVDEETRRQKNLREFLFHLIELDGAGDGVGSATAELALVVNGRALFAQIDLRWKGAKEGGRRGVKEIALIGNIGDPAVALDFSDPSRTGGSDARRAGRGRAARRRAAFFWHGRKLSKHEHDYEHVHEK